MHYRVHYSLGRIPRGQLVTWQQNYIIVKIRAYEIKRKKALPISQSPLTPNQKNTYVCASKTWLENTGEMFFQQNTSGGDGLILWKFWKIIDSLFKNFPSLLPRHLPTSSTAPLTGRWLAQGFQVCVGLEIKPLLGLTVSRIYSSRTASPWERLWSKAPLPD